MSKKSELILPSSAVASALGGVRTGFSLLSPPQHPSSSHSLGVQVSAQSDNLDSV